MFIFIYVYIYIYLSLSLYIYIYRYIPRRLRRQGSLELKPDLWCADRQIVEWRWAPRGAVTVEAR